MKRHPESDKPVEQCVDCLDHCIVRGHYGEPIAYVCSHGNHLRLLPRGFDPGQGFPRGVYCKLPDWAEPETEDEAEPRRPRIKRQKGEPCFVDDSVPDEPEPVDEHPTPWRQATMDYYPNWDIVRDANDKEVLIYHHMPRIVAAVNAAETRTDSVEPVIQLLARAHKIGVREGLSDRQALYQILRDEQPDTADDSAELPLMKQAACLVDREYARKLQKRIDAAIDALSKGSPQLVESILRGDKDG